MTDYIQVYRRKDGWYSWRLIVNNDIRAIGTNLHNTLLEAVKDAEDTLRYTAAY